MTKKIVGAIDWDQVGPKYKQVVEFLILRALKREHPDEDVVVGIPARYYERIEKFLETNDPDTLETG